jgi:hypothetical protein
VHLSFCIVWFLLKVKKELKIYLKWLWKIRKEKEKEFSPTL